MRSSSLPGIYRYIVSKGAADCTTASYAIYTGSTGGLSFYVYDGSTYVLSPDAGAGVWDGNWHHVVGTYDGAFVRLYVDGVEIGNGSPATISIRYGLPDNDRFYIGVYGFPGRPGGEFGVCDWADYRFVGDIDEVRVWQGAHPPVADAGVTLDPNQYGGRLCISDIGCAGLRQPRTFDLLPGTYDLTDIASIQLSDPSGFFGRFQLHPDGSVTLDAAAGQYFTVAGRTITARVTPVTIDRNGYPGRVGFAEVAGDGTATFMLIPGRRYALNGLSSRDLTLDTDFFSAAGFGVGVSFDGTTVTLDSDTARHFTATGATITVRVAPLTIDLNGYAGTVSFDDVAGLSGQGSIVLIVGRRYALKSHLALDLTRDDAYFSAAQFGVGLSLDGTSAALDADTARYFTVAGATLTARVASVVVDPNGYPGTLCVEGLPCGPAGQSFPSSLLIGRRYTLQPAGPFALDFTGRCSPTVLPYAGFDIRLQCFNSTPVADAGPDQSVTVDTLVTLDATASSDPDGDPLTYQWTLASRPAGSAAALSNPALPNPTFTADVAGSYTLQLIVSDGTTLSPPDTVAVSTVNSAPVADAGPDQSVTVGTVVTLDGTRSFDVDGDSLSYQWAFTLRPAGSAATLSDPTATRPTFAIDVAGTYTLALVVADGSLASAPDTVAISTVNSAPTANAGPDRSVNIGTTVALDGTGSTDPDGDPLSYSWSLLSRPGGSTAVLTTTTGATTSVTPDVAGSYTVQLMVSDGALTGTATVMVVAVDPQVTLAQLVQTIINTINGLPPSAFQNPNMARALTNKLEVVRRHIEDGQYANALNQVENDILRKTDGCAVGSAPDANDFIVDCAAQGQVYPDLIQLRDELRQLANP